MHFTRLDSKIVSWIEAWNLGPFYYEDNGMRQMTDDASDRL